VTRIRARATAPGTVNTRVRLLIAHLPGGSGMGTLHAARSGGPCRFPRGVACGSPTWRGRFVPPACPDASHPPRRTGPDSSSFICPPT
jgi:hypothetical protein